MNRQQEREVREPIRIGKVLAKVVPFLLFLFAVWMQFYGRARTGHIGLYIQLGSLALILLLLWLYNRRYR